LPEPDFVIRRMSPGDMDAVVRLWKGEVEYHTSIDPRLAVREDAEESFRQFLTRIAASQSDVIVLAADVGGEIAGFLVGMIRERTPVFVRSTHGYITDIYVDPRFRRRGIGRRLVEAAEEWFAARGMDHVRLQVAAANEAGLAFWRSVGFGDYFLTLWKELGEDEDGNGASVPDR
jgi:ribosomal protein S18 acetylase RimI-like enzyme